MARVKGGANAKKKHNRTLKLAKGYKGARSKQYRVAKQSVMRALSSSYTGRKQKKRQFRQLWIRSEERRVGKESRSYQCGSTYERSVIQQIYAWFKTCRRRTQQKSSC